MAYTAMTELGNITYNASNTMAYTGMTEIGSFLSLVMRQIVP